MSGSWEGELKFWDHDASSDECVLNVQGAGGIMCICILSEGGFATGDQVAAILANVNKTPTLNHIVVCICRTEELFYGQLRNSKNPLKIHL